MYLARGEKCRVARDLQVEAVCRSREEVWQTGIPIGTVICILPLAHDILRVGHRMNWSDKRGTSHHSAHGTLSRVRGRSGEKHTLLFSCTYTKQICRRNKREIYRQIANYRTGGWWNPWCTVPI